RECCLRERRVGPEQYDNRQEPEFPGRGQWSDRAVLAEPRSWCSCHFPVSSVRRLERLVRTGVPGGLLQCVQSCCESAARRRRSPPLWSVLFVLAKAQPVFSGLC